MLLDVERKRVRKIFLWEKYIREAVMDTREKLQEKNLRHCKSKLGYDDPTGESVAHKNTPLKKVYFVIPNGKRVLLMYPEKWLEIVEETYAMYEKQPIHDMIKARAKGKSPDVLADFGGIDRNTYYRWEREFLDDAAVLAAERRILREKK